MSTGVAALLTDLVRQKWLKWLERYVVHQIMREIPIFAYGEVAYYFGIRSPQCVMDNGPNFRSPRVMDFASSDTGR